MEKEREFDSVQIKSDSFNKVIKFEELKVLTNLNDVKQYLLCPTPGCNAKLIWVNARQPYLKALHNEDHDPKLCSHYREKGAPYHRSSQRTVQVNLPGNAILSRLDRLASSALPSSNPKSRKKGKDSKSRKARHKTNTDNYPIQAVQFQPQKSILELVEDKSMLLLTKTLAYPFKCQVKLKRLNKILPVKLSKSQ